MSYTIEIKKLVDTALAELAQVVESKKIPNTPVSKETFMCRWLAQAAKKQRFSSLVLKDSQAWVKAGRSKGIAADLVGTFTHIQGVYHAVFGEGDAHPALMKNSFDAMIDRLRADGWMIHLEYEIHRKSQVYSDGQHSFVVCSKALMDAFNEERCLIKPLSLYVRAPAEQLVQCAYSSGFLVKKISDYKSIVKYHAEYQIWPNNRANGLVELPICPL